MPQFGAGGFFISPRAKIGLDEPQGGAVKIKFFFSATLLSLLSLGLSAAAKPPKADAKPSLLFAQTAMGGRFDGKTLKLKNLSRTTLYFADRPSRVAGHVVTSDFFKLWKQGDDSFEKVPPNAVVSVIEGGKATDAVVELSSPSFSGDGAVYGIKVLSGGLPETFGAASVFIDGSSSAAMGNLYQATAQALANAAHNATTAQQNANTILQATTTRGVSLLYGVDTSATAVGIAKILAAGK